MRTLGIVSVGQRVTFNAQFTSNASDSTGNYTTSIVNSVTFSAGNAVWGWDFVGTIRDFVVTKV